MIVRSSRLLAQVSLSALVCGLFSGCSSDAGDDGLAADATGVPGAMGQQSDANGSPTPGAGAGMGSDANGTPAAADNGTASASPNGDGTNTQNAPTNQQPTVAPDAVVDAQGQTVDCTTLQRPPTPLRRLTRFEYNNTVRDLFGTELTPADDFPPDEVADGYSNNALVLTVSSLHAEKYMEAAEALAAEAVTNLETMLPCDPATVGEEACAQEFAESFGARVYRRALSAEQVADLMAAYAAGSSFERGIEVMIRAMLQSPNFLFRVEFTGAETPGAGMVRLNGYETATRLSYLLWGTGPDASLLAAAEAGELETPEQVATKARQMLQEDKARVAVTEFYKQWLSLTRLDIISKDTTAFPLWSADMVAAMNAEAQAVVEQLVWGTEPTLQSALTTPVGLPVGPLASLYGMPESNTLVTLPSEQSRSGLLTLPGFMSVQAHPDQTSPVLRGKFIRAKLLCVPPPPPPGDAMITPPDPAEGGTARERFSRHLVDDSCAACHALMDPLGFALENFDAMGVYRTTDDGQEIDVSGEMVATEDIDGPFNGPRELAEKLASSEQVKDCVATQWYKYAMGRGQEDGDACSLNPLQEQFAASGANLLELMVNTTRTEAFLYRRAVLEEVQ